MDEALHDDETTGKCANEGPRHEIEKHSCQSLFDQKVGIVNLGVDSVRTYGRVHYFQKGLGQRIEITAGSLTTTRGEKPGGEEILTVLNRDREVI